MHKFLFYNKFIIFLYMFRAQWRSKLYYTAFVIITLCRWLSGAHFGQLLKLYWDARSTKYHRNICNQRGHNYRQAVMQNSCFLCPVLIKPDKNKRSRKSFQLANGRMARRTVMTKLSVTSLRHVKEKLLWLHFNSYVNLLAPELFF